MGYFDGLVAAAFKTDAAGHTVFHPWGIFGKGRVVTDPDQAERLRVFVKRYYQVGMATILVLYLFGSLWLMLLAAAALTGWFLLGSKKLLGDAPYSNEKLTWKESLANSAKAHNLYTLWALLGFSVLSSLGMLWLSLKLKGLAPVLICASMSALMLLCAWIFGRMIRARQQ